ncbi:MAG: beta-ketoacyl-ACP synthase III [Paracoccaceae bacterium]|jgi:3-oxoacyl-[acyl-carrier-protein] synthase-3
MITRAVVKGVGHYLPKRVVENSEFEASIETSDAWIRSRSGIERRHFAEGDETTSTMAAEASRRALEAAGLTPQDVDAIVVATSSPDHTFPSVATMVQAQIGANNAFAFDVQAVCAGFIFALSTAQSMIASGQCKTAIVIGAETFSKLMDWTDRGTCVLFGDGAGALVLSAQDGTGQSSDRGVLAVDLNSDGRYKDILYVDGGVITQNTGFLRMQGKEVFRHAVEKLAQTAETVMAKTQIDPTDIDWIIPHQANIRIIQGIAKKLNVDMAKVITTVQDHGNTSAASIPLAMSVAHESGRLKAGDLVLSEAIGGGLAWGSVLLRW